MLRKLRKLFHKGLFVLTRIKDHIALIQLSPGSYCVREDISYYSQFASPELVRDILEKRISAQDDPKWLDFGFLSVEDYEFWSWRACGIICLKMIVDTIQDTNIRVNTLVDEGLKVGAYIPYDSQGKLIDKGWFYKPLIELSRRFSLNGTVFPYLSYKGICREILKKHFFIASVNPEIIRFDETTGDSKKGGHLILVHGFEWAGGGCKGFYIHNPSGKSNDMRKNAFIPIDTFIKAFGERGFSLWKE